MARTRVAKKRAADSVAADAPAVILVEPQMGENIGMVARAMLNFALSDLRLVRPRDPWPNPKAINVASGADVVLEGARLFETPEPMEHAGGRAYFTPILSRSVLSHFLPFEAVVWRAIPAGDYLQSYQRYEDWRVAPGDSVPLLPLRRESGRADVSH